MMDSTQKRVEEAVAPLKSAAGDVRRAKTSALASVQELKQFLQQHRGKGSRELLGELGKSNLVQAMVKSTLGCLVLMAVMTVVPYAVQGKPQPKVAAKPVSAATVPQSSASPPAASAQTAETNTGAPNGVDVEKAQKVMGLNEVKAAPGDVNPREKDLDNLLDGVK